jgi:hypothetical protein
MKQTGRKDMDDDLKRLYALAPDEEPPPALDHAILARARRAVATGKPQPERRWGPPLAAAAVLVLGVAVTLNMQHEQPEVLSATGSMLERTAVAPPAKSADVAPAESAQQPARRVDRAPLTANARPSEPHATAQAAAELSAPASLADTAAATGERREAASGMGRDMAASPITARAAAPAMEAQRKSAEEAPSVGASVASAYAPQPAPSPQADVMAPQTGAPAQQAGVPVPPPRPQGAARATLRADGNAPAPLQAETNMTPEQWLAHLAELKAQGRRAEFERSLAGFRKRYPAYRIPEALLPAGSPQP